MNLSPSKHAAARAAFVMEQHIGHRTYYQNLRRFVEAPESPQPEIAASWVEVTYHSSGGLLEHLPMLPGSLRGPLAGSAQALGGLRHYDVAFFNTQVPAMLSGGILRRKPYVLSVDITPVQYDQMAEHYGHPTGGSPLVTALKKRLNQTLFQRASRILPWSHWAAQSLVEDYKTPPEKIEVLPPGIDLDYWHPAPRPQTGGPVQILFVGGDFFRKGGRHLLDAFRRLPPGTAELVLVTRTPLPQEPGVRVYSDLQPNSPELIALYQSSDIFVLPSLAEAFGIAAVEAGAAGLPVIASRVGGLADIVIEGVTGFLVPPGDAGCLFSRLERLVTTSALRREMGWAGRARAEQYFDARKNARRIVDILIEIASRASK